MNIIEQIKSLDYSVYSILHGTMVKVKIPNYIELTVTDSLPHSTSLILHPNGKYKEAGECLIFPSKENRDWASVQVCQFYDGEPVLVRINNNWELLYHTGKLRGSNNLCYCNQQKSGLVDTYFECISLENFKNNVWQQHL